MATSLSDSAPASPALVRERFWNLPNTITVVRLAVIPVLLAFPLFDGPVGSRVVAWLFIISALGDILDGVAARWGQQVTRIGKLLDPLADKLTVTTALIILLNVGRIPGWATTLVVVIIGRELAVTGLRNIIAQNKMDVSASSLGKYKTGFQIAAIIPLMFHYPALGFDFHAVGMFFLWGALVFTLWSGVDYFLRFRKLLRG